MLYSIIIVHRNSLQVEIKVQKDELQRQRDTLQRQIDLFEEQQRRNRAAMTVQPTRPRTGSADRRGSPPYASVNRFYQRSESPLLRAQSGTCLLPPCMTTQEHSFLFSASSPATAIGGSPPASSSSTLDSRQLARTGSDSSLIDTSRRDPLSVAKPSRSIAGTNATSTGILSNREAQQLLPVKLLSSASTSGRVSSTQPASGASRRDVVTDRVDPLARSKRQTTVSIAGPNGRMPEQQQQHQPQHFQMVSGRMNSIKSASSVGNVLPMKLAENRSTGNSKVQSPSVSETTMGAVTASELSSTAAAQMAGPEAGSDVHLMESTQSNDVFAAGKKTRVTEIYYLWI